MKNAKGLVSGGYSGYSGYNPYAIRLPAVTSQLAEVVTAGYKQADQDSPDIVCNQL